MLGRYRPRRAIDVGQARRADGMYMLAVALFLVAVALGLVDGGETTSFAAIALSGLALGGWAQERLLRQAQAQAGAG